MWLVHFKNDATFGSLFSPQLHIWVQWPPSSPHWSLARRNLPFLPCPRALYFSLCRRGKLCGEEAAPGWTSVPLFVFDPALGIHGLSKSPSKGRLCYGRWSFKKLFGNLNESDRLAPCKQITTNCDLQPREKDRKIDVDDELKLKK